MKVFVLSMMGVAGLVACGITGGDAGDEVSQEVGTGFGSDVFYDNFNALNPGPVVGQNGWLLPPETHSCVVVAASNTDKNLYCTGDGSSNGQQAMHPMFPPPNRNYHFQYDFWMSNVTAATHGKAIIDSGNGSGAGAIFQIITGCNAGHAGIRATFEYSGPTAPLLTDADCNGHYRVACIWHDHGFQLRCGASRLPFDPAEASFQVINTPEELHAGSLVRVVGGIGGAAGTTTFDKVQVLSD